MSTETPTFDVFEGKDDQWYWHLQATNGEIVAQSEGYASEQAANDGVAACKRNVLAVLGINTRVRLAQSTIETIEEADGELSVAAPDTRHFVLIDTERADEVPI
jgi:uncharacterized protein YegP (UPF0339 family)